MRNNLAEYRILVFIAAISINLAGCGVPTLAVAGAITEQEAGSTTSITSGHLDLEADDIFAEAIFTYGTKDSTSAGDISQVSAGDISRVSAGDISQVSGDDIFSDRDMNQEPDLDDAIHVTVTSGQDVDLTAGGIYILSGTAEDCTVRIEADKKDDKVQLVLDNVSITNTDSPCIYVISADKVFVTLQGTSNHLEVTERFTSDGDTNTDGAIFSKDDLTLNGIGGVEITSHYGNGIVCKDDLKATGGTWDVTSEGSCIQVHESISICGGIFNLTTSSDGLHCKNKDDDTEGSVYIADGTFNITAGDDGIHATTFALIEEGTFNITALEGIEATYVCINGGKITITASDDGINAADKSSSYDVVLEINGGTVEITMGSGDTDALDANGDLYINGGTLVITAQSPFDYDGIGELNGGTVIVNGTEVSELTNQFAGGFGRGFGGVWGGA